MRITKTLTRILVAAATTGLVLAPLAHADPHRYRDRHHGYDRHHHQSQKHYQHHHKKPQQHYHGHNRGYVRQHHHYNQKHYRPAPPRPVIIRTPPPVYYAPPQTSVTVTYGYKYGPHYHRGYAPRYNVGHHYQYAPRTVYINDYHRHGLYQPPSGYHWVRDNDRGDAILASVATGAIIGLVVGALAN